MAKVREYENSAEIATFLHVNDGEAYVKSYTATNEPLKVDSSNLTKKVGGVRVKMLVEEDTGSRKDGSFYKKTVWNEQERDNVSSPTSGYGRHEVDGTPYNNNAAPENKDGLTPLQVLKNFVDNIAADVRQHTWLLVGVAIIAAAALAVALLK
jgi:hypothetical protein